MSLKGWGCGMCAIAGILRLEASDATVSAMEKTMRRRGPDDKGVYQNDLCTLLHSRLAIIDPEHGVQPMRFSRGEETFVIVYNGELYNTGELRSMLTELGYMFKTHTDTEVVLLAYVQWKEAALQRLNGIFSFAVWEEHSQRLFLARDRMGVKPLFYAVHNNGFLFASEIKTILAYPTVSPILDAEDAAAILMLGPGRIPGRGIFHGIEELKPGFWACYQDGHFICREYWKLLDGEMTDRFEDAVETVRYLVTDAISRQMVSDVPIGTFLSGGLDSSIISSVCSTKKGAFGEILDTFSVDYKDNEKYFIPDRFQPNADGHYIDTMRHAIGSRHHTTTLTPQHLIAVLEDATKARDLPGMADVDFSLLAFCRDIRKTVKVALSGECADEIFGGYPWYRDPKVREADGFPWSQNTAYRKQFLQRDILQKIDAEAMVQEQYLQTIRAADIRPGTSQLERRMKEMVCLNHYWFMQTLLERKDRMSMYCGLEVRVPFCDYRIAEYLYKLPWEYKDYGGREKGLLRKAVEDVLPQEICYRKKSPYPKTFDPAYLQIVSSQLRDVLDDANAPIFALVRKDTLHSLLDANNEWPWYGQLMRVPQTIAYMLQINFWMKEYKIRINW